MSAANSYNHVQEYEDANGVIHSTKLYVKGDRKVFESVKNGTVNSDTEQIACAVICGDGNVISSSNTIYRKSLRRV